MTNDINAIADGLSKLLPCPFCGGPAELRGICETAVVCVNDQCISAGPFNDWGHEPAAIAAWNTRSITTLEADNASLREQDRQRAIIEHAMRDGQPVLRSSFLDANGAEFEGQFDAMIAAGLILASFPEAKPGDSGRQFWRLAMCDPAALSTQGTTDKGEAS